MADFKIFIKQSDEDWPFVEDFTGEEEEVAMRIYNLNQDGNIYRFERQDESANIQIVNTDSKWATI